VLLTEAGKDNHCYKLWVLIIAWAIKSSDIYSKSPFGKGKLRGIFLINGPNDDQEQIMNAIC